MEVINNYITNNQTNNVPFVVEELIQFIYSFLRQCFSFSIIMCIYVLSFGV